MSKLEILPEIDLEKGLDNISEDTSKKITAMCELVYDKPMSTLTRREILDVLAIDIGIIVSEFMISASATRRTEVQYCTNQYYAAVKLDCTMTSQMIMSRLKDIPDEELVSRYISLKATTYKLLRVKYQSNEQFLRDLLQAAQDKDNIVKVGRYNV